MKQNEPKNIFPGDDSKFIEIVFYRLRQKEKFSNIRQLRQLNKQNKLFFEDEINEVTLKFEFLLEIFRFQPIKNIAKININILEIQNNNLTSLTLISPQYFHNLEKAKINLDQSGQFIIDLKEPLFFQNLELNCTNRGGCQIVFQGEANISIINSVFSGVSIVTNQYKKSELIIKNTIINCASIYALWVSNCNYIFFENIRIKNCFLGVCIDFCSCLEIFDVQILNSIRAAFQVYDCENANLEDMKIVDDNSFCGLSFSNVEGEMKNCTVQKNNGIFLCLEMASKIFQSESSFQGMSDENVVIIEDSEWNEKQ